MRMSSNSASSFSLFHVGIVTERIFDFIFIQ
jgi:hypothetical protein